MSDENRPHQQPPEDVRPDVFAPVDVSEGNDWGDVGPNATRAGVLSEFDPDTGESKPGPRDVGYPDPLCWRLHDLGERDDETHDVRLSIATVNDFDGSQEPPEDGQAPHGQPEGWSAENRSTRERDRAGRVAIPSSQRRIVDSEDGRHALALRCPSPTLGTAGSGPPLPSNPAASGGGFPYPEGIAEVEVSGQRGIAVGGVTFLSSAAIKGAQEAINAGGTAADAARWASAAARGVSRPPLVKDLEAQEEPGSRKGDGSTITRPQTNPGGSVTRSNRPGGYVHDGNVTGLLGTFFTPSGQGGSYFAGSEGTPIGPLPARHDAQFAMGEGAEKRVGRILFTSREASSIPEGNGKAFKGEMAFDSSRANQDTEVGHETGQWRPVVTVDAQIPPSGGDTSYIDPGRNPKPPKPRPPKPWTPQPFPWNPPPIPIGPKPGKDSGKDDKRPPWPGEEGYAPGGGGDILVGGGRPVGDLFPVPSPAGGVTGTAGPRIDHGASEDFISLPPVGNPTSQARNLEDLDNATPCPNTTTGMLAGPPGGTRLPGHSTGSDGKTRTDRGYPNVTVAGGQLVLGGLDNGQGGIEGALGVPLRGGARIPDSAARFGSWNAANFPLPFFGDLNGAADLQGYLAHMTATVRAVQSVVMGLAGGPGFLNANLAAVELTAPGRPHTGHTLGQRVIAEEGTRVELAEGQSPLRVWSVLEGEAGGAVNAQSGGVLEVIREHRGGATVTDNRPLVLLDNDRGTEGRVGADMVASADRAFAVTADAIQQAAGVSVQRGAGLLPGTNLFEVGHVPADQVGLATALLSGTYLSVEPDGSVVIPTGTLYLEDSDGTRTAVTAGASSATNAIGGSGADGAITRSANTQEGSVVNATSYTLDATYTAYSAINRPLVLKTTGDLTVNGTLGRNGAGALEPA